MPPPPPPPSLAGSPHCAAVQDGQGRQCGDILGGVEGAPSPPAPHQCPVHLQDHEPLNCKSSLSLSCGEWREAVLQAVNIGEVLDTWVPEELSEEEKVGGRWWRQLFAGGGAGAG